MKTLFISHSYLSGNGGGVYASKAYINMFAAVSDEMSLLYPYKLGNEPLGIKEGIEMIPVLDNRSNAKKFLDLIFGKVHRFESTALKLNNEAGYDTVVFDNSVTSSRLIMPFKKAGIRVITIHHNYQVEYLKADSKFPSRPFDLFWTRIYEGRAVRESDLNLTLTKQDAKLLADHYDKNARFEVLGVFESQNEVLPSPSKRNVNKKYIITGGLSAKQTEDSLIRWINKYYPVLKTLDPAAEVKIAGYRPSQRLKTAILNSKIELVDSPDDMMPFLKEADYYICPIDCGGGLKLRIMDGLKMGLPVVTHQVSLRGYEAMQNAGYVFSYNNQQTFEESVRKLKNVTVDGHTIQNAYSDSFGYEVGVKKLEKIIKRTLG